jgi:hypothetical protein
MFQLETTPDPASTAPPPPVDTYHQQQANKFLEAFTALQVGLPAMAQPHPTTESFVQGYRAVPVAFNDDVIWQTSQTPDLQLLNRLDVADARNRQQFNQGWRPVLDEMDKFTTKLRFQLGLNHAIVSAAALQTYAGGKALARDPGSTTTHAAVKIMGRHFKGRGLRKLAKQPPPTPPVVTAPANNPGPVLITGKVSDVKQ